MLIIIEDGTYMCDRFVFPLLLNILFKSKSLFISECVKSYGENCKHPCSQHCINQTCDRFTGKCSSWCHEGFYGEKCTQGDFIYVVLKLYKHEFVFIYVFMILLSKFCFTLNYLLKIILSVIEFYCL